MTTTTTETDWRPLPSCEEVRRAQAEAAERAEYNARLEVLGGKAPRGGLVGNRQQRRAGLRRAR